MSSRRPRELRSRRTGDVSFEDESDVVRFFGDGERSRQGNRKLLQLCKQVERSAALTLACACESEALLGAAVASVEPAPDSGRLMVTVVLACGKGPEDGIEARAELLRLTPAFREDAARAVHRKRVPQLVFDVRLAEATHA